MHLSLLVSTGSIVDKTESRQFDPKGKELLAYCVKLKRFIRMHSIIIPSSSLKTVISTGLTYGGFTVAHYSCYACKLDCSFNILLYYEFILS